MSNPELSEIVRKVKALSWHIDAVIMFITKNSPPILFNEDYALEYFYSLLDNLIESIENNLMDKINEPE